MDGLSGVASVFGVVSFTLQLAEGARKLYNFWSSVDEAPENIKRIARDLKLLSNALTEIAQYGQKYGHDTSITDILESCTQDLKEMTDMTKKIESGIFLGNRKKWSAIKAIFKEEKIRNFQTRLLDAKSTLILARQTLLDKSLHKYFDHNGEMLAAMTQGIAIVEKQTANISQVSARVSNLETGLSNQELDNIVSHMSAQVINPYIKSGFKAAVEVAVRDAITTGHIETYPSEPSNRLDIAAPLPPQFPSNKRFLIHKNLKCVECPLGKIIIRSHRFDSVLCDEIGPEYRYQGEEKDIRIIFRPADWLLRLGLAYELRLAFLITASSWRHSYHVLQPVPDDSLVFKFARSGNIDGLKGLLSSKDASVWDVDSYGWTPLLFAAHNRNLEVCRFLISQGATLEILSYRGVSCFSAYFYAHTGQRMFLHQFKYAINIYRLLNQHLHLLQLFAANHNSHGLKDRQEDYAGCFCHEKSPPIKQVFPSNIREDRKEVTEYWNGNSLKIICDTFNVPLWRGLFFSGVSESTVKWITENYRAQMDSWLHPNMYSPIMTAIVRDEWHTAQVLIQSGATLHHVGFDAELSPIPESATSLSLYNILSFKNWKATLARSKIYFRDLVDGELNSGRLLEDGWDFESLRTLFNLRLHPYCPWKHPYKCSCTCWHCCTKYRDTQKCDDDESPDEKQLISRDVNLPCGEVSAVMVDFKWQRLLERIRQKQSLEGYIDPWFDDDPWLDRWRDISDGDPIFVHLNHGILTIPKNISISETRHEANGSFGYEDESDDDQDNESAFGNSGSEDDSPEWYCANCWHRECCQAEPIKRFNRHSTKRNNDDEKNSPLLLDI